MFLFVDLLKVFDVVDHDTLLAKLEHYDIHSVPNEWCKSYLFDRKKFVTINGHVSIKAFVKYGVQRGSVFGALLFLTYISNLTQAVKVCKVHHFTNDTTKFILVNQ